ncbi:hypothetical protein [Sulfolobus acidocaldarius]|uniref:hypothetical protein n=1 Tax=Sulfolobus acidocaldarius TaxID=2285 RepID=UPI000B1984A5|nr:hypothetical protein [Sulfolobus acidocaldarius]
MKIHAEKSQIPYCVVCKKEIRSRNFSDLKRHLKRCKDDRHQKYLISNWQLFN